MGVRTTNTDGGYFIYDSVTGYAIGEIWEDGDEADDFLEYCIEQDIELRSISLAEVERLRNEWSQRHGSHTPIHFATGESTADSQTS